VLRRPLETAQYASEAFQRALQAIGGKSSMSSTGNCFDNAAAESFFSTLKQELIHRHAWPTKARAKAAIADYIDHFYNPRRRHSFVGNISPLDFELRFMQQAA
jgi:putative transposase